MQRHRHTPERTAQENQREVIDTGTKKRIEADRQRDRCKEERTGTAHTHTHTHTHKLTHSVVCVSAAAARAKRCEIAPKNPCVQWWLFSGENKQ